MALASVVAPGSRPAGSGRTPRGRRFEWLPFLLVLPTLVSVVLVLVYPLLNTIWLSFVKVDLFRKVNTFVGLKNYARILGSSDFWAATRLTLSFAFVVMALATVIGMLLALLLTQEFIGRGLMRALLVLPWSLPWVIIGLMWAWVADAQFGSVNGLLKQLGLIDHYIPFLASPRGAFWFAAIAVVWRQASLVGLLGLAALQSVPRAPQEAAMIDGASGWQRLWYITYPWLQPSVALGVLASLAAGMLHFDTVFMMTGGGPGNATQLLSIHLYRQIFVHSDFGGGATISNLLGVINIILGLTALRFFRTEQEGESA